MCYESYDKDPPPRGPEFLETPTWVGEDLHGVEAKIAVGSGGCAHSGDLAEVGHEGGKITSTKSSCQVGILQDTGDGCYLYSQL